MAKRNYKIVIWGDSICCTPPENCWGGNLAKVYQATYCAGVPVDVVNSGVGGTPARVGAEQFQEKVARHHPDLVILQFGMNDMRYDGSRPGQPISTPDEYEEFLTRMVKSCRSISAEVLILGYHQPATFGKLPCGKTRAELVALYNERAERAACREGVDFINPSTVDLGSIPPYALLVPDCVHLSPLGVTMYTGLMAGYLAQKLLPLAKDWD